jgi:DNA-binding NtrC family response regulator
VDKDRLRAELLAAARTAVEKLTDDQCAVIYLEIEQRLGLPAPHERADSPEKTRVVADLPFAEAKRRAVEDVERAYLTRLMEQAHGCVATAAELARMDRSNFRRRLQHVGLRAAGKKTPVSCMDQILQILGAVPSNLRWRAVCRRFNPGASFLFGDSNGCL